MHKKIYFLTSFLFLFLSTRAQPWIDTLYQIQTLYDVSYGTGTDFAGNTRNLTMDISVPVNDTPPVCGRPLLLAVHGGAFMAGSKQDAAVNQWRIDFAKRGFVAASVNYRLGMFQTGNFVHCNVTGLFNTPWDCMNMADTAEWYRACYRAMQDVKGSIRYLVSQSAAYQIDPRNVFLAGESAGGFIVLQAAYMDTVSEKPLTAGPIPDVISPNLLYESTCIQGFGLDTSVASMILSRPDLGSIEGSLHTGSPPYRIRAVGNVYGGMMGDLLSQNTYAGPPALYLFHQPNDLIVPIGTGHVFAGYSAFFTQIPFSCGWLINTPVINGSASIKALIDSLSAAGVTVPSYVTDFTTNTADAWQQYFNPSLTGHSLQDYWGHTFIMAQLFAGRMDTSACPTIAVEEPEPTMECTVFPNPAGNSIHIKFKNEPAINRIEVRDAAGRILLTKSYGLKSRALKVDLPDEVQQGTYFLFIYTDKGPVIKKITAGF